jgi:carbon-monoxide dehydrogenase large subunit
MDTKGAVKAGPSFPNGCHIAEVEIDPNTGELSIERYTAVGDSGNILDHVIAQGQMHGGIVQGLGQALSEAAAYDQDGQLLSGSFMDYGMPRAHTVPRIDATHLEIACKTNPLGVKGIGEAGTTAAPPAVINAIMDALPPNAVLDMPATSERIWRALQDAGAPAAA